MKVISVKCPECGATLDVDESRTQVFCSYCGSKVLLQNENEHVIRVVDEADIKRAETDKMVKSMRIDAAKQKREELKESRRKKLKLGIIFGGIGALVLIIGAVAKIDMMITLGFLVAVIGGIFLFGAFNNDDSDIVLESKAKIPDIVYEYEKKTYSVIEESFKAAGFTNVKSVPLNDLTVGVLKKPGFVESITVGGKNARKGDKCPKDAPVIISYHSKK